MEQYLERWRRADSYARAVACRVRAALECAGLNPCEIGGAELEAALIRYEIPLTVAQLSIVAMTLDCSPVVWVAA